MPLYTLHLTLHFEAKDDAAARKLHSGVDQTLSDHLQEPEILNYNIETLHTEKHRANPRSNRPRSR